MQCHVPTSSRTLARRSHRRGAATPRSCSSSSTALPNLWHPQAAAISAHSAAPRPGGRFLRQSSVAGAGTSLQVVELQQSPAAYQQEELVDAEGSVLVPAPSPSPASTTSVLQLTPETFQNTILGSDSFVLVDFYTSWCGPCRVMHKEMDKLTQAFPRGVTFAKFNCGDYEEFSTKQRIRSLPTFRLFKSGRMIDQVTGAKPIELRQLLVHYVR